MTFFNPSIIRLYRSYAPVAVNIEMIALEQIH